MAIMERFSSNLRILLHGFQNMQIRVTPYNFTSNHRTFTVSGISDHINPSSIVEGEGSEASASVSNTLGGQGDEPNPSGYEGKEGGGRKRP
ncbi:hypothetical protein F2Q69_00019952 [Brassica cretica]|uniref:Uncharacterized protein n=1 Tax=Brassica cretica TaxID=69181 RepID=A0A8S9QJR5_BRACR|nr:hypothetical protein F2Q69_00019952 [Brassica cretica]